MERFELTEKDKMLLKSYGYHDEDISQIGRTRFSFENYNSGEEITAENAIHMVGRNQIISGLGRATFHSSAVRTNLKRGVYIESDSFN